MAFGRILYVFYRNGHGLSIVALQYKFNKANVVHEDYELVPSEA